jgi:hypothetical protein
MTLQFYVAKRSFEKIPNSILGRAACLELDPEPVEGRVQDDKDF